MAEDSPPVPQQAPWDFPVYRRVPHGRNSYRIEGPRSFTEVQHIGTRWVLHRVDNAAYPEQVRIQEMLACTAPYEPMDPDDWEGMFAGML